MPGLKPWLFLFCCLWVLPVDAAEPLVGSYTHGFTEPGESPVWKISHGQRGYQALTLGDGEQADAWLLNARGRAAFWEKMSWPVDSSATAVCLSWGIAPPTLESLLDRQPPPAMSSADQYGTSVLCQLDPADKNKIDWLADYGSDFFYYDPLFGVTESRIVP